MAELVLDENGNSIDKDGNKKPDLLADYMNKADVMAIVSGFAGNFSVAAAGLDKICNGSGFSEGYDGLAKLITAVTGGPHVEFARKNSWITDPAQRNTYLTTGGDQGIADKQFVIDFYKLVASTADLRASFVEMINNCLASTLYKAYGAIRFEAQMSEIVKQSDLSSLGTAFASFSLLYDECNDAKIYNHIPVSKSKYSAEENLAMVLEYLNDEIYKKPDLVTLFDGAEKPSAEAINKLYIYDRETKQFDSFASKEDAMQRVIDACAELDAKLAAGYAVADEGLLAYLNGYRIVMEKLVEVFQKAIDVIEKFKTQKDTAPYAIMHYNSYITRVNSMYSLCSLKDPVTEGSNYRELALSMIARFRNLAKNIAKNAPA